jgi:signal transduction histidine kinase
MPCPDDVRTSLTSPPPSSSTVSVRLEHFADGAPHVTLTVEDDGGGDASNVRTSSGHGILGIRERLAGLGGALSIGNAPRGLRVHAIVPVDQPEALA